MTGLADVSIFGDVASMDIFGTKRRRALQAGVDAMRPMIGILQHFDGVPPGFWIDDFVLGYTTTIIGLASRTVAPDLNSTQKGEVLAECLTSLSNQNGQVVTQRYIELTQRPTPDFNQGVENAFASFVFSLGRLKNEDTNQYVLEARKIAVAMGQGSDRSVIGGILVERLFHQVIRERFTLKGHEGFFGPKRDVREAADMIETACKWILPALFGSSLDDFVKVAQLHEAEESYRDPEKYGFFLSSRSFVFHVEQSEFHHHLLVESRGDYYGLTVVGHRDQPIDVSIGERLAPLGNHAKDLKTELLERSGFHSIEDIMKDRGW